MADPWLEILFFNEAFDVAVDQAGKAPTHFNNPSFNRS